MGALQKVLRFLGREVTARWAFAELQRHKTVRRKRSQKFLVMDFFLNLESEEAGRFWVADFLSISPGQQAVKLVTENFTTFFTATKIVTWNRSGT